MMVLREPVAGLDGVEGGKDRLHGEAAAATSWPLERRSAAATGAAQRFSHTSTATEVPEFNAAAASRSSSPSSPDDAPVNSAKRAASWFSPSPTLTTVLLSTSRYGRLLLTPEERTASAVLVSVLLTATVPLIAGLVMVNDPVFFGGVAVLALIFPSMATVMAAPGRTRVLLGVATSGSVLDATRATR